MSQNQIPNPGYPTVTHVVSQPVVPHVREEERRIGCPHCQQPLNVPVRVQSEGQPITWVIGAPHPLTPKMTIVRIFAGDDSVEIYSLSEDRSTGMRNAIPMSAVKLIQEGMPLDVFVSELQEAESAGDEEEDGDDESVEGEEGDEEAPPADQTQSSTTANGQTVV